MNATDKIMQARTNMIVDNPFFGFLCLRLHMVEDCTAKTFWTDGESIGYNPKFVDSLTLAETITVLAHEVMHVACLHPWRRDGRDNGDWQKATDYVVNQTLADAGFVMPKTALLNRQFDGLAAEQVFDAIHKDQPKQSDEDDGKPEQNQGENEGDGDGQGQGQADIQEQPDANGSQPDQGEDDFGPGEVRDGQAAEKEEAEAKVKMAVLQAAQAAKDDVPAGVKAMIQEIKNPTLDWRNILRKWMQTLSKDDYTWRTPNTRHLQRGFFLPSLGSESMPPICIWFDTSGSIFCNQVLINEFAAIINEIVRETQPERVYVGYADTKVQKVETFERGEEILIDPIGGGGTDFAPAFEWIETEGIEPTCVIYLTDLCGYFPKAAPDYPVLWASTYQGYTAPFGDTVYLH